MNIEDLKKEIKQIEDESDFVVSWYATKERLTNENNTKRKKTRNDTGNKKYVVYIS